MEIHTLAYGFFIGNHKDLARVSRLLGHRFFSSDFFKIHRLVWIFLWVLGCFINVLFKNLSYY
jgi:hypothetical protein